MTSLLFACTSCELSQISWKMQTFEKQSKEKLHKKASCFQIPWLCAWIPTHFRQQAGADTEGGCRGCVPPTSPKEVLTWHVISLKIIAKIFLYCTLLNHYESKVHSYGRVSCSNELAVHTCPLLCLQKRVAKVAIGLFYCWSSLRNNSMATNLQRFTLYYGAGVCCMILLNAHILAVYAARQWHADSGKPRTFILCEKKHEWVYSNASTSLKNQLSERVWRVCLTVKLHLCRILFIQYKITWLFRIHLCRLVVIRFYR